MRDYKSYETDGRSAETGSVRQRRLGRSRFAERRRASEGIAGKNTAFAELQKNEPKPLKTRSRAQNRAPFDRALGDFA
jgi:hypothetical protein